MSYSRILIVLLALAVCVAGQAADWPQFRGPARDGISAERGLLTSWPETGPQVRWRVKLGEGYSGLSVVGERIYTMFAADHDEFVVCLEVGSGKELWRHRIGGKWVDRFGNGPRATPTVVGGLVYALGSRGDLAALDAKDGSLRWGRDLVREYGVKPPQWGMSSSPLVEGDMLLVNVGGKGSSLVAFKRKTGEELWRSQDDPAGYAAPIAATIDDVRQAIFFTAKGLVAVRPADGTVLWRHRWKTSYDVNAATPIVVGKDQLFVSTGYDVGGALLKLTRAEGKFSVEETWRNREMKNKFSSSVLHDGHLYGFDEKTLKCVVAASGELLWRKRGLGHGSLIVADGHLIVMGEAGQLVLVRASPVDYQEVARIQVFDGKTWTMPTLADGNIYVRDEKELVSLDIAG